MKRNFDRTLPGFSLIETSIVLLIIGIVAGAALKGKDVLDSVRLKTVASDIQVLQIAYDNYVSAYSALPGDDKNASKKFSGVEDGDGDLKFSESDAAKVFKHLFGAGLIDDENYKIPKIGGSYDMIAEDGVLKLRLSNGGSGFLTRKQVTAVSAKCNELLGKSEDIIETDPKFDDNDSTKYVLKVKIG